MERVIRDSEEVTIEQIGQKDGTIQPHENYANRLSSKYKGASKKELRTFENQKIRWYSWSSVDKWNMR